MTAIHVLPLPLQMPPRIWLRMPNHYPHVALDAFVIMPSHVHGIIVIADTAGAKATRRGAPTEGDVGRHPRASARRWQGRETTSSIESASSSMQVSMRSCPPVP